MMESRQMYDVLVVDKEPVMRRVLRLSLQGAGYSARLAVSDVEALRLVGERLPDAVIADVDQQACDGNAFIDWLVDECGLDAALIFCITARTSAMCRSRVSTTGVVVMEKPFSTRRLVIELARRLAHDPELPEQLHDLAATGST